MLKLILQYLRNKNIRIVAYLDDLLIIAKTKKECLKNLQMTQKLLEKLGFIINFKKCQLIPNTECKFLGFIFDSKIFSLKLPIEKREKIYNLLMKMKYEKQCSIRQFSKLIGNLIAARPAIRYG